MKKIAILLCLALVSSCTTETNNLAADYKGYIITDKSDKGLLKGCVGLRSPKGKSKTVFITDLDYKNYNLGDTIK